MYHEISKTHETILSINKNKILIIDEYNPDYFLIRLMKKLSMNIFLRVVKYNIQN